MIIALPEFLQKQEMLENGVTGRVLDLIKIVFGLSANEEVLICIILPSGMIADYP